MPFLVGKPGSGPEVIVNDIVKLHRIRRLTDASQMMQAEFVIKPVQKRARIRRDKIRATQRIMNSVPGFPKSVTTEAIAQFEEHGVMVPQKISGS